MDKRKAERRVNRKSLILRERRTGFDRRSDNHNIAHKATWHLSNKGFLLASLLLLINALNLADLAFTYLALRAGYQEANPVLRYLFVNFSPLVGGYIKLAAGLFVTLVIWHFKKYRRILEGTFVIIAIYLSIFLYHLFVTLAYI